MAQMYVSCMMNSELLIVLNIVNQICIEPKSNVGLIYGLTFLGFMVELIEQWPETNMCMCVSSFQFDKL